MLHNLDTNQIFCSLSFNMDLSSVFSLLDSDYAFLVRISEKWCVFPVCHSRVCLKLICLFPDNTNLDHLIKDWCWSWNSNTLATWCKGLTHLKRPWSWERLKAGGEGDNRGWDGWIVSPAWRIWLWVSSRSWWWTGKPGILQSMGSQRVNMTEWLNWLESD